MCHLRHVSDVMVGTESRFVNNRTMKTCQKPGFCPLDPDFERKVRINFDRQELMQTLSATLVRVKPGNVAIKAPVAAKVSQQADIRTRVSVGVWATPRPGFLPCR